MGIFSQHRDRGFTSVELLVSLSIAAILFGLAVPSGYSLVQRSRANSSILQLMAFVQFARHTAVTKQRVVTLCGSINGIDCTNHWLGARVIVFADSNNDHNLDENEEVFMLEQLDDSDAIIRWKASGGRKYLRYLPDGSVKEFGHFLYCPADKNIRFARSLIITNVGRAHTAKDRTGDGIREDSRGSPLICH